MQADNWKQRTQQLGKKNLEAYIPTPSNKSSTHVLSNLFSGDTSGLDAFSLYHLARSCPAMPYQTTGRPERRQLVPLVLEPPSPQTTNTSIR